MNSNEILRFVMEEKRKIEGRISLVDKGIILDELCFKIQEELENGEGVLDENNR